jgi:cytochrome c
MKRFLHLMLALNICALTFAVNAEERPQMSPKVDKEEIYQLIKDRGYRCLECHSIEKQVVGPAWKEVAANRKNHKWAHELLAFRISTGSVGEYGTVEMPHNEVQDDDVHIIVDWILSLWQPGMTTAAKK